MALPKYPTMDVEDYLILDRNSKNARYEYLDGELRMLAGGSTYHSAIIANLTGILTGRLESGPCWVFNTDIRLQLSESRYVHPDVTVSCDERDQELDDMIHYPCLVVEVLSPTTEASDRGEKFSYYQECPTIHDYVLVDSQSIHIEVYHREEDGWKLHTYGPGSTVTLEGLGIQFPINAVYRGMKLTGSRNTRNLKRML
jgi:Uma2 family endonuclease